LHPNLPIVGVRLEIGCQDGIGVCHGVVWRCANPTASGAPCNGFYDQSRLWVASKILMSQVLTFRGHCP
jgi:hypothetical protein